MAFNWSVNPVAVSLGPIEIRWYGILFALAFLLGRRIMTWMMIRERLPLAKLDALLGYMCVGTIVGARLGHCLLYEPNVYLNDPIRILKVWEGGLASHGAGIGIILSLALFSRCHREFRLQWLVGRISICVALAGVFIRLGNLMNSEIIGKPTDVPWAFIFSRVDPLPRHPTQLYEATGYLLLFGALFWLYLRRWRENRPEATFGVFLTGVFSLRFLLEFLKENQVSFEAHLPLNMGQILSIPAIVAGLFIVFKTRREPVARKRAIL